MKVLFQNSGGKKGLFSRQCWDNWVAIWIPTLYLIPRQGPNKSKVLTLKQKYMNYIKSAEKLSGGKVEIDTKIRKT